MKRKAFYLIILVMSCNFSISQGITNIEVTYNKHMKSMLDSSNIAPKQLKDLSYKLKASKKEATYSIVKTMSIDGFSNKRFVGRGGGDGIYYKNIETKTNLHQKEFSGKKFIISYDFNKYDWKITKETKTIGLYKCYKATTEYSFYSKSMDENLKINITAWFTPEIPLPFGPAGYDGLPGLVLEAQIGGFYHIASKIELNKEHIDIKTPTAGKQVSFKEYEAIVEKVYGNRNN